MAAAVTAEPIVDGDGARAGVTITGLGAGGSVLTLWRSYDDQREDVAGYRRFTVNDGTFVIDHHVPVGRPVTYEAEILSGPGGPGRVYSAPITLDTTGAGILSDPLVPQAWVPLVGTRENKDSVYLRDPALQDLEQRADISLFKIMGSNKPLGLFGERQALTGVDTSVGSRSAEEAARLNRILEATSFLLFRPSPDWGVDLPGVMFLANPAFKKIPVNTLMGGDITWWDLKSDVVSAPTIRVLTSSFSYGDVAILMSTYGQKQSLMAGKTYLDDLKNPLGG